MRLPRLLALGLLAAAAVSPAHATLVTLSGVSVDFVIDDSQPGLALYGGLPTVSGDSLLFFPTTFRAESTNGQGTVPVSATINFQLRSHSASAIDLGAVTVSEVGDYFITPSTPGSVSAVAQLGATNLQAGDPIASFRQDIEQTGTLTGAGANAWSLATNIDFRQVWTSPTDLVRIDLQNNLSATTSVNPSDAWIQKKFEGMRVDVAVVPLPAALPLLLSALGAFGVLARRRARA
jgi:hypothetical protein